MILNQQLMI